MTSDSMVGVTGYSGHLHPGGTGAPAVALARCVDVPSDVFADKYWGRSPLLTQGWPDNRFADLFDAAAVDELVSTHGLRTPFARMAKDGNVVASERFTRSGGAGARIGDQLADDKVLGLLAEGSTLVLQGLHRTWPPLVRFATALTGEIGHPVQINAYVTPPQNQGFAAHYDNHDVFVLQVLGRKQWRIHDPVITNPLPQQKWEHVRSAVAARASEPALIDTILSPGDSLYLPRGYLHSAVALGELTIHLTVGVHPLTRARLLRRLAERVGEDARLRVALPMGVDLGDPGVLAPHLGEIAAVLGEAGRDPAEWADGVASSIAADLAADTRPEPIGPLQLGRIAAALTLHTRLRARSGLRYELTVDATSCALKILDKTVKLPATAAAALPIVLHGAPFTPAELPAADDSARLALVRQLMRDAVLVSAADRL